METQNGYEYVQWGDGKKFLTYSEAWKHANDVVIPDLLKRYEICGKPVIRDGRSAGTLIVIYKYIK